MSEIPLEMDVKKLSDLRDDGVDIMLIDVREEHEHAIANKGSVFIPLGQLPLRAAELPKDKWIVVHCHHGGRSMKAVEWLRQNGFPQSTNVAGGIDHWSLKIDPTVARY